MTDIQPLSKLTLTKAIALADEVFPEQSLLEHGGLVFRFSLMPGVVKHPIVALLGISQLRYWVALLDNQVAGVTGLYSQFRDSEAVWLGWTCVAPQYRGQGIGGELLDFAIAKTRTMGKAYLRLVTSTHPTMATAQYMYESRGLKVVEVKPRRGRKFDILIRQMAL